MIERRQFLGFAAASVFLPAFGSRHALAQTWPARFVRIVVPFTPGGANDAVARIVAARLAELWGQQVVIENKGGAGGNIGIEAVARADSDGYTILISSTAQAVNRFLYPALSYDPVADFAPVTLLCLQPNIMVVPNSSPAKSVMEFIEHAKKKRGAVAYASAGNGTSLHLCGELFKRMAGIEMTHVPYRGSAPALSDLMPGRVDAMFNSAGSVLGHVRAGRVRGLAVTTLARAPFAPELPTIAEAGVPGFDVSSWFAFFVPAKTSPEIVKRMHADTVAALAHPPVKEKLEQLGATIIGSTPAGLAAHLKAEMGKWGPVIIEAGIKSES
jgi:tripartite-type tricarboxylate transporter receptor subunit TctC